MLVENLDEDEENNVVERSSVKERKNMEDLVEHACRNNDKNMNQEKPV